MSRIPHPIAETFPGNMFFPYPNSTTLMPKLFEYAIVFIPKQTKDNSGNDTTPDPEVLQQPKAIYAESETAVTVRAAREIPEDYTDRIAQVQVLVRPFK
jgi:hypothetical protein